MALNPASMKSKIMAAYTARTGMSMTDGAFDVLIDVCTGIVQEIVMNGTVVTGIPVTIPSTSAPGAPSVGATTAPGSIL
jgi:hypothetical protein